MSLQEWQTLQKSFKRTLKSMRKYGCAWKDVIIDLQSHM
jgi:hypothetical protein